VCVLCTCLPWHLCTLPHPTAITTTTTALQTMPSSASMKTHYAHLTNKSAVSVRATRHLATAVARSLTQRTWCECTAAPSLSTGRKQEGRSVSEACEPAHRVRVHRHPLLLRGLGRGVVLKIILSLTSPSCRHMLILRRHRGIAHTGCPKLAGTSACCPRTPMLVPFFHTHRPHIRTLHHPYPFCTVSIIRTIINRDHKSCSKTTARMAAAAAAAAEPAARGASGHSPFRSV